MSSFFLIWYILKEYLPRVGVADSIAVKCFIKCDDYLIVIWSSDAKMFSSMLIHTRSYHIAQAVAISSLLVSFRIGALWCPTPVVSKMSATCRSIAGVIWGVSIDTSCIEFYLLISIRYQSVWQVGQWYHSLGIDSSRVSSMKFLLQLLQWILHWIYSR